MRVIARPDDGSAWRQQVDCMACGWLLEADRDDLVAVPTGAYVTCPNERCRGVVHLAPPPHVAQYARERTKGTP